MHFQGIKYTMEHSEGHHHQVEQYGTTVTLPQTGCLSKINEKIRKKKLVRGNQEANIYSEEVAGMSGNYWLCCTCDKNSLCIVHVRAMVNIC